MNLLFIYGLQKKGEKVNYQLNGCRMLQEDVTFPIFTMKLILPAKLPIVIARGNTAIHGEIYALTNEEYINISRTENVPYFTVPKKIKTKRGFFCTIFVASPNIIKATGKYFEQYPTITSGLWSADNAK